MRGQLNLINRLVTKHRHSSTELLIRKFGTQFAYGHREILFKHAGISNSAILTGILQHGVGPTFTLSSDWPTPRNKMLSRAPLWLYSREAANEIRNLGVKNVKAIGSPWLYSKMREQRESLQIPKRSKYMVFPRHYADSFLADNNITEIQEKIKFWRIIAGTSDMEVCLYWTEFTDKNWQEAARRENVILRCAGVPSSSPVWSQSLSRVDFYKNLREIISSSTHCIFESFTSAVFYANDLGKPVGIFTPFTEKREVTRKKIFQDEYSWLSRNLPGIFETCELNSTLDSITQELLGYQDLLEPEDLKNTLKFREQVLQ